MYPSLLNSFLSPPTIVVVSEERLKQAEREAKENQLKVIDNRMDELSKYRLQVQDELKALSPAEDSKDG